MQEKQKPKQGQVFIKFHTQKKRDGWGEDFAVTAINEGETSVFVDALKIVDPRRDTPGQIIQLLPSVPVGAGSHQTWLVSSKKMTSVGMSINHAQVEIITSPGDVSVRTKDGEFIAAYLEMLPASRTGGDKLDDSVPL